MIEPEKSDITFFEKEYHCWKNGNYIGIATFTDDENIGPSFISMSVSSDGELINEVYLPDKFIIVKP